VAAVIGSPLGGRHRIVAAAAVRGFGFSAAAVRSALAFLSALGGWL
jgi:hypothetical protein